MPNNCLLDDRKTKICLPGQAANDLAKTRAYPNSRPPSTKAKLLLLKLIQIFARAVLVTKKLEIEETKTT